jgi:hypothetical protein
LTFWPCDLVASHYDTTALDMYYQTDKQFGFDGEEDEEDDYVDEDQRELQKRGIKGVYHINC